ncbi:MAG: hypothetical protein KKH12_02130 [Gammaproteobacteria bacterium]|nr:hypothetical protein [Gammaproteobacteria bacterium]MBU1480450.1 hypothetical protein [Gammaproteobacteria bacterium]
MRREYSIYKTLKQLAKQRVALVLQPGNVWVIERAIPDTEENNENIQTCLMRGWVEILHESIPNGRVWGDGLPTKQIFEGTADVYRLTDSGWNAIHRTHVITLLGVIAALLGAALAL